MTGQKVSYKAKEMRRAKKIKELNLKLINTKKTKRHILTIMDDR